MLQTGYIFFKQRYKQGLTEPGAKDLSLVNVYQWEEGGGEFSSFVHMYINQIKTKLKLLLVEKSCTKTVGSQIFCS